MRSTAIRWLRVLVTLWYARRLRRYPGLRMVLDHCAGSTSNAIDLADAIALYEHVLQRKPACILELGSGTSTQVICMAIEVTRRADPAYCPTFLSFESEHGWLQYHEQSFMPFLRKHVDLRLCPIESSGGVTRYEGVPRLPYDFVFVDGPDLHRLGCESSADVIDLAPVLASDALVVFDGRAKTVERTFAALQPLGFSKRRHPYSWQSELYR